MIKKNILNDIIIDFKKLDKNIFPFLKNKKIQLVHLAVY